MMKFYNSEGTEIQIALNIRPHCKNFLQESAKYYEIVIFTAATKEYAEAVVEVLDPEKKMISAIISREKCFETRNGFMIKDLRIFQDRSLKDVIMIDNLAHSFGLQIDNGIPIYSWNGDMRDQELKNLTDYVQAAAFVNDIRQFNRTNFRLDELVETSPNQLDIY